MVDSPVLNAGFMADEKSYQQWRRFRLRSRPSSAEEITVEVDGLPGLTQSQVNSVRKTIKACNMAIYRCRDRYADRSAVKVFAARFGLSNLDHHLCTHEDGVSELSVAREGRKSIYVPYSNRSLSWHTDGYYNDRSRQVNAVVLHCVQAAEAGGENALLNPEIAYIMLRDADPRYIRALEHPHCLTIPANNPAEGEIRSSVSGPVFSYDGDGRIHMRYSARKKNIKWREDTLTREALDLLSQILNDPQGPAIRYCLKAGEGLISNNVLHNRSSFTDGSSGKRLLYRARFFDGIHYDAVH